MINEKEKQEKILNFNIIVGNQNNNVANEFLSLANWNVSEAVNLYLYSMSDSNKININNQNNLSNFKYITEYSFGNSGFLNKVGTLFKSPFMKNNSEYCNNFIGKIKCLVKTGDTFTNFLKSNKGVIILYSKDNLTRLNQQLEAINNDDQHNYLNSVIFYPIINNSIEGSNLIKLLNINRFPCYLFCKYKSSNVFYILDKMEGIFYLDMFKNTLFPQNVNSNINKLNKNKNDKSENNYNNINKNNNEVNKNVIQKNNIIDNKNKIVLYNNQIPLKNEIKIENKNNSNYINNEFSILNSQNLPMKNEVENILKENNNFISNKENKSNIQNNNNQNNINNNIQININNNIINNNINNDINNDINNNINNISSSKQKPKKEYIPDYRDYQFDNEPIIPIFKPFDLNEQIMPSYSNYDFNNYQQPLSDSEIRKFQDNEMKELEKFEEEREKIEKEEKEKKRKEEEEKKKMEEKEKEDKELFSMLIPPEPDDDNPDKCVIIFRLPDGEKNIQRKFLKTDKVAVLYDYIRSLGKEIYSEEDSHNFSIIQTFPYKNFENKINNTLEEEGLFPNSMLQIKENN